jgi:hypothetical protein
MDLSPTPKAVAVSERGIGQIPTNERNMTKWPNNGAAGNSHRPFSFDGAMKFEHHLCSQRQAPVAMPELGR